MSERPADTRRQGRGRRRGYLAYLDVEGVLHSRKFLVDVIDMATTIDDDVELLVVEVMHVLVRRVGRKLGGLGWLR